MFRKHDDGLIYNYESLGNTCQLYIYIYFNGHLTVGYATFIGTAPVDYSTILNNEISADI